jgi:hypothetical protein
VLLDVLGFDREYLGVEGDSRKEQGKRTERRQGGGASGT